MTPDTKTRAKERLVVLVIAFESPVARSAQTAREWLRIVSKRFSV